MDRLLKRRSPSDMIETVIGTILRTPGLVLCDCWHQKCLDYSFPKSLDLADLCDSSLHLSVLLIGFVILMLPLELLVKLYMHCIAGGLLFVLELASRVYVDEEVAIANLPDPHELLESPAYYKRQVVQVATILAVSAFNTWCLDLKSSAMKAFPNAYLLPIIVRFLNYPADVLHMSLWTSSITVLFFVTLYLVHIFPPILTFLCDMLHRWQTMTFLYGNFHGLVYVLAKLFDPLQFILYWIALFLTYLWLELVKFQDKKIEFHEAGELYIGLLIVSQICDSPLTLIASCITIMALATSVIRLTNAFLDSCKSHAPPSTAVLSGVTEGMVMFLLSLQTGLIDMKLPQRLGAMSVILFIVTASLFQTVLEITHPVLLALSASSRNLWSHVKVLGLCAILCFVPAYMSHLLILTVDLDLWTMVVISSSMLTSIQVVGHFIHYLLYLCDSFRQDPMDAIDDYVYYLKSAVHALELMSALFVVCAGLKEAVYGHWSLLNTVVLIVHCYFNVWVRIKSGWRSFLLRQAAVSRIQTLVDASEQELRKHNDVCAICYSDMLNSAKITPCGHFFHGGCLKKWLYVQDHCPLCSAKVIEEAAASNDQDEPVQEEVMVDPQEEGDQIQEE